MKVNSVFGTACICLAAVSFNVGAAVVEADWKNPGDKLISLDEETGLQWLDLTESYGLPYDDVSGQLGVGGDFEGFRYATNAEVQILWANFGIDLSVGATTSVGFWDPNVETAAGFLGNTWNLYQPWDYPFGASGITATSAGAGLHYAMGAYQADWGPTNYETAGSWSVSDTLSNIQPYGSYLVVASPVPVPAAIWLFGSALIGLLGMAQGKREK